MLLCDTHAHLDDEQFDGCHEEIISRARDAELGAIICVGTTASSSEACVRLAARFEIVLAAIGIQPNYCSEAGSEDWLTIQRLASDDKVVALGETGLDRHWDFTPFPRQQEYFDRHLQLSQKTGLPLVIHMRDSGKDIVAMVREARRRGPIAGVMHSFTGDADLAAECLDLGLYISFAGMVTYKKSDELRHVAAAIPTDRLLMETDSPYLSPHPKRGQRPNEPALLVHTASCLAECRGVPYAELVSQTTTNARRLFTGINVSFTR